VRTCGGLPSGETATLLNRGETKKGAECEWCGQEHARQVRCIAIPAGMEDCTVEHSVIMLGFLSKNFESYVGFRPGNGFAPARPSLIKPCSTEILRLFQINCPFAPSNGTKSEGRAGATDSCRGLPV
jgi:hypothetical protein